MRLPIPLLGRLTVREYLTIIFGFTFLALDSLLKFIILFLPKPVINWFYRQSRSLFYWFGGRGKEQNEEKRASDKVLKAKDFEDLCNIHGYTHEEHVVLTKDGYLLGLHRIPAKRGERRDNPGTSTGKPVVYLHHGLLMNSEVWICLTNPERSLAFVLAEQGYDVWLGNNRGNKYSKKSIHHGPNTSKFWDFSMDEFAWHDIPDTIHHILQVTKAPQLSYVGFSQGTAQAFAALSIHPQLNEKVNVFIALAPAMSPAGLAAPIVDGLMKASPTLFFLLFGRKSILSSATFWQSIIYPPIFAQVIDKSLVWLFNWHSHNISTHQKIAAYAHLYSFASVKSIVHWFQIMRNAAFQMYDDDVLSPVVVTSVSSYRPARFPTRNIVTPIVLMYGDSDSLVDIDAMLTQLPSHTVAKRLHTYEHLDILWGQNVHVDVIPKVLASLELYNTQEQTIGDVGTSSRDEMDFTAS
ncbi:triacylglycerol lipase [Macrolepiota fuliginosa MF-IS2]|uniref:Triacylglycerol lipase n=1 Tax=Macrolepiota fuliginosa MF-IS2 TaxID=1400762 RepID=A0A9P5XM76_9AGAR|nr:triacylglycerol lipase [Macrolepiota fuliginosa MF-IS2]